MSETKRVVVTGATGLIGKQVCKQLIERGYELVVFTRSPDVARRSIPGAASYVQWTAAENGPWTSAIDGVYGVINLAGASLFGKRWTEEYKREIRESRTLSTRGLVNAILAATNKPAVFVSGSAVGYYGFHGAEPLDESAPAGSDFLARVCVDWENEALRAETVDVRTVMMRTGVVLAKDEGALPLMLLPFKMLSGGPVGSGNQWLSWIHIEDIVGLILLALENEGVRGALNGTAPEAMTNRDFSAALGRSYGTPSWLQVPGFAIKAVVGELGDMILEGQRVVPRKSQELGYTFRFPTVAAALGDVLK